MGKVYLVGAGPGDPELITVKGLKAVQQADVILYDRLVNRLLLDEAHEGAKLVYCGKSPDRHSLSQETINSLLVKYAKQGNVVTRLKGGDPFIFGRGGEEAEYLRKNGISFEVVPGITSGSAAPAYAGIPLTHREYSSSVAFVSGAGKNGEDSGQNWEHLAKGADTLCIYMGVKHLPDICEQLLRHGRHPKTPVALVYCGTTDEQQTVTGNLENITTKAKMIRNPAMIIIGDVVRLREKIQWYEWLELEKEQPSQVVFG
ncbi:uroporphyrinogen-III C-methyltransferase [Heyndrickxia acidiproducens]|uniref:uroporphyrinogen-III C-methyltransferase n=1 Tax=Heyndrickxia acidiproducens TaxID=1121084 RepID=UPI00035DF31D|nr:uroporphyrinogen-III C-methyltransferase [Heyndrickxia acidiproducens]